MGSEGVPITRIHVTGFKKFHGVAKNPTEVIVGRLAEYVKESGGLPTGCTLESSTVLETAGEGALKVLKELLESSNPNPNSNLNSNSVSNSLHRKIGDIEPSPSASVLPHRVIWVHLGVNSAATKFAIERRAVNEATFRCPDELGWQPQRLPIIPEDGSITTWRETELPAEEIVKIMCKKGYEVTISDDAGRFVCNYVYYQSLKYASETEGSVCIFVHVPLFSRIEEETQVQFVASLLEVLAELP